MDLNRAQLIGRITQEPELRQTANGQSVVSFSVATNRSYKDNSGQQVQQAEFHNIVAWGKLAEIIAQYCEKGKRVFVEGRLQTRSWEDQSGNKRYKTEIVADNLIMLDKKGDSSYGDSSMMSSVTEIADEAAGEFAAKGASKGKASAEEEISIEDVPF